MESTWTKQAVIAALAFGAALAVNKESTMGDQDNPSSTPASANHSSPAERVLRKEVNVSASLADVWRAWTTSEGAATFFAPEAKIELAVGGAYEIYFKPDQPDGSRGTEGCRVLSYLPMRMLSFEWNAPPSIPRLRQAGAKTHVVLEFEELPAGQVQVTMSQLGFGQGEDWDKYYDYFDRAWPWVLGELQKRFAPGASSAPDSAAGQRATAAGKLHWVYFVRPSRPGLFEKATEAELKAFSAHVEYLKRLFEQGTVVLAGPCFDPEHPPQGHVAGQLEAATQGIVIFEADGLAEAQRIMAGDPAVEAGLFKASLNSFTLALARE